MLNALGFSLSQFSNKLILKALYDAQELINNMHDNPKLIISVPFYTGVKRIPKLLLISITALFKNRRKVMS